MTVLADLSSDQHGEWVEINDVISIWLCASGLDGFFGFIFPPVMFG